MKEVETGDVRPDRYSYSVYPDLLWMFPASITGGFVFVSLMFATMATPAKWEFFFFGVPVGLALSALAYWSKFHELSFIELSAQGMERLTPKNKWLSVPWSMVENVVITHQKVDGKPEGTDLYVFTLKPGGPRRTIRIAGFMNRKDAFREAILTWLHSNHITVDDQAEAFWRTYPKAKGYDPTPPWERARRDVEPVAVDPLDKA